MACGAVAAVYCSRRAHPIASRISAVNNLHYGAARALTLEAQHIDAEIVLTKDYAEALKIVADDKAAALALDDVLLYGLRANAEDPSTWVVAGTALQVEPYACMVRKDDPVFKRLVDGTLTRLMKSGEFTRLYVKWFESPIPPRGANLDMPMSAALKGNLVTRSDRPAQ